MDDLKDLLNPEHIVSFWAGLGTTIKQGVEKHKTHTLVAMIAHAPIAIVSVGAMVWAVSEWKADMVEMNNKNKEQIILIAGNLKSEVATVSTALRHTRAELDLFRRELKLQIDGNERLNEERAQNIIRQVNEHHKQIEKLRGRHGR